MSSHSSTTELVNTIIDLISLPEIYLKVRELLNDPASSMADIAAVVSVDPNLTSRILRLANSAYCGFRAKIDTVNRAMTMLGTQQVHDIVLSTSIARSFSKIPTDAMDMEVFWRSSVICGACSKVLSDQRGILDSERMFTAGLLAHVGRLVLFMLHPGVIQEAYAKAASDVPIAHSIDATLGFNDADIAGELLERWGLPTTLVQPVRHRARPERIGQDAGSAEAEILHVASAIADMRYFRSDLETLIDQVDESIWTDLDLQPERLEQILAYADSLAEEITEQFLP